MFLKFKSQDERKQYGGSCFIEISFCKLPKGAKEDTILSDIHYWREDSLYVSGGASFNEVYKDIFGIGLVDEGKEDLFDFYGVTYYKPEKIDDIIKRAIEVKPEGYEILTDWLKKAKSYNGFYILGM